MTKTLSHRLRDACRERGYALASQPDEPVSSPPYEKWWGCVYDPATGHVAALVTNARGRRVIRQLLADIDGPPPVVRSTHRGKVLRVETSQRGEKRRSRRGHVEVQFEDGKRDDFGHPIGVPIRVGWPVSEVRFEGHDGPLVLWGPDHIPRRRTEDRKLDVAIAPAS